VKIDFVKAVGRNQIFLNWTVDDGNQPIQQYSIQVNILTQSLKKESSLPPCLTTKQEHRKLLLVSFQTVHVSG
jgi:hypothetical protein